MRFKHRSNRTRRHIRHFQKKRIDYAKYIDDFYLDEGLAYISCNVTDFHDVIDDYSVEGYEDLNPSFISYIEQNAHYIPVEYPIVLEICGGRFNAAQQKTITETVEDNFALKLGDAQLDLDGNRSKALKLLILGIMSFIVVSLLGRLAQIAETIYEALLIPFWFFLWEFGDLLWWDRGELLERKTEAARLASIKVVFKDRFRDDHDGEEVTQEIFEEVFSEED